MVEKLYTYYCKCGLKFKLNRFVNRVFWNEPEKKFRFPNGEIEYVYDLPIRCPNEDLIDMIFNNNHIVINEDTWEYYTNEKEIEARRIKYEKSLPREINRWKN